jgi:hypothetical protein
LQITFLKRYRCVAAKKTLDLRAENATLRHEDCFESPDAGKRETISEPVSVQSFDLTKRQKQAHPIAPSGPTLISKVCCIKLSCSAATSIGAELRKSSNIEAEKKDAAALQLKKGPPTFLRRYRCVAAKKTLDLRVENAGLRHEDCSESPTAWKRPYSLTCATANIDLDRPTMTSKAISPIGASSY